MPKRLGAAVAAAVLVALLVAGCGPKTGTKGGQTSSGASLAPAVKAAVPFSQLKAGALDTVDFVSDSVGYVGGQGLILKSQDGGKTWVKVYTTPDNVVSVDAVNAETVWAATKDYLLRSTDGRRFEQVNVPSLMTGKGIAAIDFLSRNQGFVLADSVIWRVKGTGATRATPPVPVDSLSFVDAKTGFAAGGNLVWATHDGGRTWNKVFTAPVEAAPPQLPWRGVIHASSAGNAWLLVKGGGAGMSQLAYVVFHKGGGSAFTPAMYEGYFQSLYPTIHLDNSQNIGAQPGPFALSGNRAAFFVGWYPDQLQLTRTVDDGKTFAKYDIGKSGDPSAPDFFSPMAVSFADTTHGWLAGSHQPEAKGQTQGPRRGVIYYTTDGKNFKPVP